MPHSYLYAPPVKTSAHRGGHKHGPRKNEITVEEFRQWLMTFDSDNDGCISKQELRQAIRNRGVWFDRWMCARGMKEADVNGDGFIDQHEIDHLIDFAERSLGFKFYH